MSAIRLLVLGAVRQHGRAHGYQVRNDLEYWGAHEWSNAKPGSIYHALKQMAKQSLLHAHEVAPSTAGGPPRTEYEITDRGEDEFFRLLRESLVSYDQKTDMQSAAIGFLVELPRSEALELLRERIRRIGAWRTSVTVEPAVPDGDGGTAPAGRPGRRPGTRLGRRRLAARAARAVPPAGRAEVHPIGPLGRTGRSSGGTRWPPPCPG
ncbi:PadR family transcriptional regulator [Streptomyces dangxiongensis]|uniref:PadR family transcriptional regulator n=1 Tax=Streptomyces dangxiongensis TaxID=1442032 RepID=UPI001F09637A|nr:PadR family transcriptional regulator [Streptomyces dangxiongensis]